MNEQSLNELHRFYSLWRENNAIYEEWSKAHGLSSNELLFLYSLYEDDNECTQRNISQRWFIPKQQEMGTIRVRDMNDSQELFIRLFKEKTQKD